MIYLTLNVTEQKNYRFNKKFLKDTLLQHFKDMTVCYDNVRRCSTKEKTKLKEKEKITE